MFLIANSSSDSFARSSEKAASSRKHEHKVRLSPVVSSAMVQHDFLSDQHLASHILTDAYLLSCECQPPPPPPPSSPPNISTPWPPLTGPTGPSSMWQLILSPPNPQLKTSSFLFPPSKKTEPSSVPDLSPGNKIHSPSRGGGGEGHRSGLWVKAKVNMLGTKVYMLIYDSKHFYILKYQKYHRTSP